MPRNVYPTINALPATEFERLKAVTADDLSVEVWDQFTDDQAQCLDVVVNGVKLALQWIPARSAAAFYFYADSPSARAEVLRTLREEIDQAEKWRAEEE
jgi:hypothetical protein